MMAAKGKRFTKAEKRIWAVKQTAAHDASRAQAKQMAAEMAAQIAAFPVKRLQTQPNSVSANTKKAPFKGGQKGKK